MIEGSVLHHMDPLLISEALKAGQLDICASHALMQQFQTGSTDLLWFIYETP